MQVRQGRLLRVDLRLHRDDDVRGEWLRLRRPRSLVLWSGCGWIESNSNTDGEQSVGQVSSPSECIAKVLDECPGFEIANLPANGVGECFCQQGGSPVPDSSGYLCGNQPTT